MQLLTSAGVVPGQRRPIGRALGLSLAVHAGLAVGLAFFPVRSPSVDTPIEVTVDVLSEFLAPPPPPAPEPPVLQRSEAATRPRSARPPAAAPPGASEQRADPEPPAAAPAEEPPPAPQVAEPAVEPGPPEPSAVAVLQPAVGAGRPAGGSGVGSAGGLGTGSGRFGVSSGSDEGNPSRRRATADRYRDELLRTRIHSVFHYPSEARELELTGRVLVTVAIHRNGQLLDVKLAGRCPHAILCADGLRTLRAAAPFPPIPSELGDSLVIEVPLTYAFE